LGFVIYRNLTYYINLLYIGYKLPINKAVGYDEHLSG
jgi:hypothetical protein